METRALRLLIRQKLADGRLPRHGIPKVWGGASNGQQCHACDEFIEKSDFVMEGPVLGGGRSDVQFHVLCFYVWDEERHDVTDGRIPRADSGAVSEAEAYREYLILTMATKQPAGGWGVAVTVHDADGVVVLDRLDLGGGVTFDTEANANAAGVLFGRAWIDSTS